MGEYLGNQGCHHLVRPELSVGLAISECRPIAEAPRLIYTPTIFTHALDERHRNQMTEQLLAWTTKTKLTKHLSQHNQAPKLNIEKITIN